MSARERFFKKVQQNRSCTSPDKKSVEAAIREFCSRVDELVQQIEQVLSGSGIEIMTDIRHINDLSTIDYSLSSGIRRYDIAALWLQNGERRASIIPEQLCRGVETGCVTLSVDAPGSSQVFYLSMVPETGWYIRREQQNVTERVIMTEERFFLAVDRLA